MASSDVGRLVRQWGERFRHDPIAAQAVGGLRDRGDEIWQYAFKLLQRESPEYKNAVDAEFTKESKAHCNELLRTIVAVADRDLARSPGDPFDFVRSHARWRARHRVPLIASLHAYRLAHRTYWELTRGALPGRANKKQAIRSLTVLSDFWIELFDHVGAVLAEAHAIEEGLIVARSSRAYEALIDDLLCGREPREAESQRLCALCGIHADGRKTLVLARAVEPGAPSDVEATMRSLVRLIEQVLTPERFGKLARIRDGEALIVICSNAEAGGALTQALRRVSRQAGCPMRIGISSDVAESSDIPRALEEARAALDFANAARPLMQFSDIDLGEFLLRRSDRAAVRLVPDWAHRLSRAKNGHWRELCRTIHAFADCNFSVKQTAVRLRVHTNTVYFRLNRINKLTGVDPRTYSGTSHLLTALRLLEIHGADRRQT